MPGTAVRPLINSSKDSYGQTNRDRVEFNPGKSKPGPNTLMVVVNRRPEFVAPAEAVMRELQGKRRRGNPRMRSDKRGKPTTRSRIAVVGDSDFATNSFYHIMGNGKLFLNTVNYLAAQENLIGIEPRTYDLPRVNLTNRQINGTVFLSIVLIPARDGADRLRRVVETEMSEAGTNRGGVSSRLTLVWGVLLALAAAIVAIELADRAATEREDRQQPSRDPRLLVPVPLEQIGAIEVAHAGAVHRFERDAAGAWFYHGVHVNADATHAHQADPAMAQRIETALQGFGRTRMERTLPAGMAVQQYGLANPQMVILVYRPKELQPLLQVRGGRFSAG